MIFASTNEPVCHEVQTDFGSFLRASFEKSYGRIFSIFASKNEAVCCCVQMYFGNCRFARYMKKVLGAFSRFMRPKTKRFAVKFRRILEVLCLQVLQ